MHGSFAGVLLLGSIFLFFAGLTPAQEIPCNNFETGRVEFVKTGKKTLQDVCRTHQKPQINNNQGTQTYSITGHITHQNGVRMSGVNVTLRIQNTTGPPQWVSVTNENGEYGFTGLSTGRYELRPVLEGYEFFPPAVFYEGLSSNYVQNFVAAGPPPPPPPPPANTPSVAWTSFYSHPSNLADYNPMFGRDAQGNIYLGGTSNASSGTGDTDIVLSKIDANGNLVWSRTFNGPGEYKDALRDMAVDGAGNVYLTGYTYKDGSVENTRSYDFVTLKYDTNGNRLWTRFYGKADHYDDFPTSLKIDAAGNVYIGGFSWDVNVFADYATLKYDTDGNLLWAKRYVTIHGEATNEIEVDSAGNVYITGYRNRNSGGGTEEIVTIKYNSAGVEQWRNHFNPAASENDRGYEIEFDSAGNVYVLGITYTSMFEPQATIQKINPATGANIWTKIYGVPNSTDGTVPAAMKLDQNGNIIITGMVNLSGEFYEVDSFTAKFDNDGNFLWLKTYDGRADEDYDGDSKLALDTDGNIYMGVTSEGFFNPDIQLIKYFPDGTVDWTHRFGNPFFEYDYLLDDGSDVSQLTMFVDEAGSVYVAGESFIPGQGTNLLAYKLDPVPQARAVPSDFDGDGKADVSVFRPETGVWYMLKSSDGSFSAIQWGLAGDKLVPADYDGDRKTDLGVFRDGIWYVLKSSDGGFQFNQFGLAEDKPMATDFDNDGRADLSVFRQGIWHLLKSSNNSYKAQQFGLAGDVPVPSDYDSNSRDDIAVFRNGRWYVQYQEGVTPGTFQFGISSDKLVPADYDGDKQTDYAVFRNGVWYIWQSYSRSLKAVQWGLASDIPVPADYDGDRKADLAVYRGGTWYILNSSNNSFTGLQFGLPDDIPIASAYYR